MIYAHIVFEIRSSKTDKLLQKKENIMKFANEDALNEFSFKQVKKLENNNTVSGERQDVCRFSDTHLISRRS